ncbi:MAG: caspase family protein [Treponema sp.]
MLLLIVIGATMGAFPQDVKNALLIANGAYGRDIGALTQPVPEARALKSALESIGFNVTIVENANFEQMGIALQAFKEKNENEGGIALFHYGGHALQVSGVNYLIPANEKIENQNKVRYRCINVDEVMDSMLGDANIVVLDSCRNNPFQSTLRGAASSRGLAAVTKRPANSIIVYSADSGQTAKDGVFTPILTKHITEKDTSIENVLKKVRRDVLRKTNDEQHTGEYSQLVGQIYLAGKTEAGVSAKTLTGFLDISVYTPCSVLVDGMHIKDLNGFSQERFELSSGIHKIKVKYADGKSESLNTIIKAGTSETWPLTYLSYDQRRVCYELGNRYFYGSDNTRKDEAQAFEYYAIAAEAGEGGAQYAAGRCYENGNGIQKDEKAAFEWYKKAAANGNADAMNALGIFYQYGKGGESTDYREAKRLYEKAVAGGSKDAERNLERINALLSGQERQTASARVNAEDKASVTSTVDHDGKMEGGFGKESKGTENTVLSAVKQVKEPSFFDVTRDYFGGGIRVGYDLTHFVLGDITSFNTHGVNLKFVPLLWVCEHFDCEIPVFGYSYSVFASEKLAYHEFNILAAKFGININRFSAHLGASMLSVFVESSEIAPAVAFGNTSAENLEPFNPISIDLNIKLNDYLALYAEYNFVFFGFPRQSFNLGLAANWIYSHF